MVAFNNTMLSAHQTSLYIICLFEYHKNATEEEKKSVPILTTQQIRWYADKPD